MAQDSWLLPIAPLALAWIITLTFTAFTDKKVFKRGLVLSISVPILIPLVVVIVLASTPRKDEIDLPGAGLLVSAFLAVGWLVALFQIGDRKVIETVFNLSGGVALALLIAEILVTY